MLTDIDYIKSLLKSSFKFSKLMGQNFLTDESIVSDIAQTAEPLKERCVIEIGPGIGALTRELASRAAKVIAVELDETLIPILSENIKNDNTKIVQADILRLDINSILDNIDSGLKPLLCSNLPYNITTPIIELFLREKRFDTAVFMLQKEAAERLTSKVGIIPSMVYYYTNAEILFNVPSYKFFPEPQVDSSVIRLTRRSHPPVIVENEELFFKIIRAAFAHRRKTLANSVSQTLSLNKNIIENILKQRGLDSNIRAEQLLLQQFAEITQDFIEMGI